MAALKCWFISFALIAIIGCAIATPENEDDGWGGAATPIKELTADEKAAKAEEERITNLAKSRSCELRRSKNDAKKNFLGAIFCNSHIKSR